jgi:prepilin-type N-terminal cleavage/methylation domain-containing protein
MNFPLPRRRARARAFSLIEMLVAVGLLSVVILALYSMFDQTQKALRNNVGQVDVFEGTRTAVDLLLRDLEEARPAGIEDGPHLATRLSVEPGLLNNQFGLFGNREPVLQEVFGLKAAADNRWQVFGYFVASPDNPVLRTTPPIGTLYRYEDRLVQGRPAEAGFGAQELANAELPLSVNGPIVLLTRHPLSARLLQRNLLNLPQAGPDALTRTFRTNAARVLDGVVNFKVTPYDHEGRPFDFFYPTNALPVRRTDTNRPPIELRFLRNGTITETTFSGGQQPAYLEVEVDSLEPRLLDQFRALPDNALIRNRYLSNNLARIQSFRERIPLRAAYR